TPDPRPPSRRWRGCSGDSPSGKNRRKNGSCENGNCCAARARRSDLMVTTAGATLSTIAAYESTPVPTMRPSAPAGVAAETAAGADGIALSAPYTLHAPMDPAASTAAATRFLQLFT